MGLGEIKNTRRTEHETLEVILPPVSALEKQYLEVNLFVGGGKHLLLNVILFIFSLERCNWWKF